MFKYRHIYYYQYIVDYEEVTNNKQILYDKQNVCNLCKLGILLRYTNPYNSDKTSTI